MTECILLTISKDELMDIVNNALASAQQIKDYKEEYLSRDEVLKLLHISSTSLWTHMKKGLIPYKRLGRKMIFSKTDVMNYMQTKYKLQKED